MVSHRQQTNLSTNAPVRFYKIVALSFLLLTVALLGVIVFMSSKRATITITTKPEPVDVSHEITMGGQIGERDSLGVATTTMIVATQTFSPTGNKQEPGLAGGMVTLRNDSDAAQALVATTRLLTSDGVLFRLKNRVTVPAKGTVDAEVYADQEGKEGNIKPTRFTIPGLTDAKQKVVYAESKTAMTGGLRTIGILSDEDVKKSEKIILSTAEEQAKEEIADEHPGKEGVYKVLEYSISNDKEVGAEVSAYTLTARATVAAAFYDVEKVRGAAAAALLKKAVSDTEIVELGDEAPTVTLDSYDQDKGAATLLVFQTGKAVLNPESDQLKKELLFGKNKEEVRRYLLSLSHVHGVDVSFRPAWMMSVPHVPDHVQVIVKNVE